MGLNCMNPLNMWIFWIYSRPFVSALLYPWIQPTLDQDSIFDPWLGIHRWEFSDAEGQLCVLFYAVICKGLEHICMLVSVKGPEKQPPWILRDEYGYVLGESKVTRRFSIAQRSVP